MDGNDELSKPSPKDLGTIGPVKGQVPKEEGRKEDRLIDEALQVGKSRIVTHAILSGNYGWQTVSEKQNPLPERKRGEILDMTRRIAFASDTSNHGQENLRNQGVKEVVVIEPLEVDVIEKRSAKVPHKRFFVTTYSEVREPYVTGQRPQLMSEITDGPEVPAAAIRYSAYDSKTRDARYNTGDNRPGNELDIKFVVPLDLAKQISAQVQQDPKFIRELTAAFVGNKYPQEFVEHAWNRYGKPPYEKWDAHPQAAIYFADLIEHPELKQAPIDSTVRERTIPIKPTV